MAKEPQKKGAEESGNKNLGTLDENPAVRREPAVIELPDGTVRTDY